MAYYLLKAAISAPCGRECWFCNWFSLCVIVSFLFIYILPLSFLFWHQHSNRRDDQRHPVKKIPDVWSLANSLRHFAHPSRIHYRGSKSPRFCLDFRHQSPLTDCSFKAEQLIGTKYFHLEWRWSKNSLRLFAHIFPNFTGEIKCANIWSNFEVKAI